MKKIFLMLIILPTINVTAQNFFFMPSFWEVSDTGLAFNIEAFDINKDGKLDIVSGNWNNTFVYFGGPGVLDEIVDIVYTGRILAICDYNGDGFDDMINMHLTSFDSSRWDYDGEILFYWGSDTTDLAIDTIPDYSIPLPTLYPTLERFTLGYLTVGVQKGDLNGDEKSDLIFSSLYYIDTVEINPRGKIYIYTGKNQPDDGPDFVLIGTDLGSEYGYFIDCGNINGDQYDDLLFSSIERIGSSNVNTIHHLHIFLGRSNFSAISGEEDEFFSSYVNSVTNTAGWFVQSFSVDDINGDNIDDIVIGRRSFDFPHKSTVHFGGSNGIDTIPSFTFLQDTTISLVFSAGGETQNVGDYNGDGYDDFINSPSGYQIFTLHLGGPHISNKNKFGIRGYSNAAPTFPQKSINVGKQNVNDNINDIVVSVSAQTAISKGYILMLYGQDVPVEVTELEDSNVDYNLFQNYPNPFNPSTTIKFQINNTLKVKITIFDTLGNEIAVLLDEEKSPGKYEIEFNAQKYNLSSGVYFYRINYEGKELVKKMTFLK
ncbi:MAG: hypothetical protein AUK34_01885 [Ignavibacteria bacterium CG2_30_36_16]|nr:MAG: hypothetical protein AUK34_01885 [Ignavibacteria bacterium CG2_30_36_16]